MRVGRFIPVLYGISAGIDRGLDAVLVDRVDSNLEVRAMRFFNNGDKFRNREIFIRCNFDHVDVLKLVLPYRLPGPVCSVDQQKFLLKDGLGQGGIEALHI